MVTVTAAKAGTKPTDPGLTLVQKADASKPSKTVVEGTCPGTGSSWVSLGPTADKAAVLGKVDDVRAAAKKGAMGKGAHMKQQWCYVAVVKAGDKSTCTFATASAGKYDGALYCETVEGWFFAITKATAVTAKDNGGK